MNSELAKKDFEKILSNFNATDIKFIDETEDQEFQTKSYIANIKKSPEYNDFILNGLDDLDLKYDSTFEDYTKDTSYGQININFNYGMINVEVKYNVDDETENLEEDYSDEDLIDIQTEDVRDNSFSFLDDWYGRLEDIIEDLKEHGFSVLNATSEWIDVEKDEKEYVIKLDGTSRTITIKSIESLGESIIPIEEEIGEFSDDELASIYGGDTAQSQKDIEEDYEETYLWYGKYDAVPLPPRYKRKDSSAFGKKVMFKFDSEDYDEALKEFNDIIPEPYSKCKLLGKMIYGVGSYKQLKNDGFEMIEIPNLEEGIIPIEETNTIVTEKDTFGDYEKNVFDALDNIEVLVSSYEEVNKDTLKSLISRLEDEIDTLKKINMKLITGIKQYTL